MQETLAREVRNCQHHWLIEPANGPTSEGVCKHCGAKDSFRNYVSVSYYEYFAKQVDIQEILKEVSLT